ncbi:single-stranded DNA-binding protein [Amycolatopsis sp. NPDC059021]|uniref:single-stranded DNA-binding protein n=1 Tax=Amycolatopsis sp. NPDC059021 TaxID=3346704 RepID=UPI00366D6212
MAVGETWVTVTGYVTSEPDLRKVGENGHDVVSFWLRSTERRYDKEKGEWGDGRRFSVRVTCWRKLARSVHQCLAKGDPVVVRGRLYSSEFELDGVPRAVPELEAFVVGPNLARCTASLDRAPREGVAVRDPRGLWSTGGEEANTLFDAAEKASA